MDEKQYITVESARTAWTHPNGEYSIYRLVVIDSQGKRDTVATYSEELAEAGWEGTVTLSLNKRGEPMARPYSKGRNYKESGDDHYSRADMDWD